MTQICLDFVNFMKDHVCTNTFNTIVTFLVLIAGVVSTGYVIFWLLNRYLSLWLVPLGQTSPLAWMILLLQSYTKMDFTMFFFVSFGSSIVYLIFAVLGEQLLQEAKKSDSSRTRLWVIGSMGLILWLLVFRNLFNSYFIEPLPQPLPRG